MDIKIRPEHYEDTPGIYEVNCAAFGQEYEANLVDLVAPPLKLWRHAVGKARRLSRNYNW